MSHRWIAAALALALAAGCAKDVSPESSPAFVDYSVFDPASGSIPLPNDLALLSAATLPPGAQKELLLAFAAAGGFPNDLEVPITVGFTRASVGDSGSTLSAPTLDLSTVRPPGHPSGATVALFRVDVFPPQVVGYDVAGQSTSGATTTLRLRNPASASGSRTWTAGAQYALAIRGGPDGVKTAGGGEVHPQPTMFLLLAGKNLADPANQALLPDPSLGAQLEQIRQNYLPIFMFVDDVFPSDELVNVSTFQIADGTSVRVDSGAGVVPLPFDLLRTDPDGTIINNPGFGPAAAGLDTLDGFSETAMMLAPTSAPIDAATVTGATVFLFDLSTTPPTRVRDLAGALGGGAPEEAVYVTQPPDINQACPIPSGLCASAIGLQPAVPAAVPGVGSFFLPPLEEDTDYAVVVTRGVMDAAGTPLVRGAVAKMILDVASPVSVGGVSQLAASGVDDVTAAALETMRAQLAPVYDVLPDGKTKADVAMAYTFKTQSTTGVSLQLSALPFGVEQAAASAVFTPFAATDVTATWAALQGPDVDSFWSVTTPTVDAIDKTTGALRPDLATLTPAQMAALVTPIPALVTVPLAANVPSCGLPPPNDALRCARLVVFGHGLGGGHLQSMAFANALAANGFVVAAIDFPLHGDRAWCSTDADCNPGGTCALFPGGAGQGDANPPGVCSSGNLLDPARLTSVASGRYFVSANFFRTRDAFRQNLIDQSALALSVARPPAPFAPQPAANPLATALLAKGIVIDPSEVYYEGISLGGIYGTQVLATNPRFTRGVLSVGGGTLVDIFTTAPAFQAEVDALFLSLGIDRSQIPTDPAVAARYLQTLSVAKWVLDPAESVVFAKHVSREPLPNLLSPTPALQVPKDAFGMVATGDTVVPNPFNFLLFQNVGADVTVYSSATAPGGAVPHSFLATDPTAQSNAADWLLDPVLNYPGPAVVLP